MGLAGEVGAYLLLFLAQDVDAESSHGLDEFMGVGAEVHADEGQWRREGNGCEGVCGHAVETALVVQGGHDGYACGEPGHATPEIIFTHHDGPHLALRIPIFVLMLGGCQRRVGTGLGRSLQGHSLSEAT